MSDPTRLHKPYTTGAEPSTGAEKASVEMVGGGWGRKITATQFAWAGNDDQNSDPEILVAFRGLDSHTAWYTYSYWVNALLGYSATTFNGGGTISVNVHFSEQVDITGTPRLTITNNQTGGGSAATLTASYASGTGTSIAVFTTAAGSSGQLVSGNILHLGINALSLNGGTIKDAGTATTATITNATSDQGFHGNHNYGGNRSIYDLLYEDGARVHIKT